MKALIFALWATIPVLAYGTQASSVHQVSVALQVGPPRQEFQGWGFTPAPSDWDGLPMARNPEMVARLFKDSGATVARLIVGKTHDPLFDEESLSLNEATCETYLGKYLRAMQRVGLQSYILSFASPPKWMKKYNADASHQFLDPNTLRPEYYDDFCELVVSVVRWIQSERLPMPAGVSLQDQPDCPLPPIACPPALPQGCLYEPTAYRVLARRLRAYLDARRFEHVSLAGPETRFYGNFPEYDDPAFGVTLLCSTFGDPIHSTFGSGKRPIWVKALAPASECNSADFAFLLTLRITHDLAQTSAAYWLWPYGYAQDDTGEVLRHGRVETDSAVYGTLRDFWRSLPSKGRIHPVSITEPDASSRLAGFLVKTSRSASMVVNNTAAQTVRFTMPAGLLIKRAKVLVSGKWRPISELSADAFNLAPQTTCILELVGK